MNWTGCGKEEVNFDSLGQKRLQIIQPAMAAGRQVKTTHSRTSFKDCHFNFLRHFHY
jgi:hypothetical protein